jgi:hypothetical protein
MRNRAEFIKRLHEDPKFKHALASVKTDAERKAIAHTVEEFVGSFGDVLGPILDRAQNDPEFARQLGQALNERQGVVTTEPVKSGSAG